jgi:hypothetical protein
MKANTAVLPIVLVLSFLILGTPSPAAADAGVFTGNGQNLRQISSKSIQLVSIDVSIIPGRGPFLFDGTVPGMDQVRYECTFVLRNLTDKPEEVQVGFPVDSQFAQESEKESSKASARDWVLNYGFIALDETTTYEVEFVSRKPSKDSGEFGAVFVWKMHFAPRESRTLKVNYHIPMSMGLVSTERDEQATKSSRPTGVLAQELVVLAQMEMIGYITSTGSSWSGNVESATFTVYTKPFERYFERRGITEENAADLSTEEAERFKSSFPVQHPWWFRQITPAGWNQVKGGVQWQYKDFKPKDPIEIRYYMTQLPIRPEEVAPFLEQALRGVGERDKAVELEKIRQLLLATYGEEPQDSTVRAFAAEQLWYATRKDFSAENLTPSQRAVVRKVDERILELKAKK